MKQYATLAVKLASIGIMALAVSQTALAGHYKKRHHVVRSSAYNDVYKEVYKDMPMAPMMHWYVGGEVGRSHLHDKPATGNSVEQNGPGWGVRGGYQYNNMFGGEIGFLQYHDSHENTTNVLNAAKTEHYAGYLAATGRYQFMNQWSVVGKLGPAYSYAEKIFVGGARGTGNTWSLFYSAGAAYSISSTVDAVLDWSRVRGNNRTGSSDLVGLGLNVMIG